MWATTWLLFVCVFHHRHNLTSLAALIFFLSILDAQRLVKIASEAVIVPKASVGVVNVHALPQAENAIQMFAGIAGSGEYMTIDLDLFGLPVSRCL